MQRANRFITRPGAAWVGLFYLINDSFFSLRHDLISASRRLAAPSDLNFSEYFNLTGLRIFV